MKWLLLTALALVTPAPAQPVFLPAAETVAMSEGVVRRIDHAGGKITLQHGPIANLDMPPMTMVFRVDPPELLARVKPGDRVKFRAENIGGQFTVTAIEKVVQ